MTEHSPTSCIHPSGECVKCDEPKFSRRDYYSLVNRIAEVVCGISWKWDEHGDLGLDLTYAIYEVSRGEEKE